MCEYMILFNSINQKKNHLNEQIDFIEPQSTSYKLCHCIPLDFLPLINEHVCENCLLRTCAIHLHCRLNLNPKIAQTNKGVAAWPDVPKGTLGNLTPADRHGSVQVRVGVFPNFCFFSVFLNFSFIILQFSFSLYFLNLQYLTSKLQSQNHFTFYALWFSKKMKKLHHFSFKTKNYTF